MLKWESLQWTKGVARIFMVSVETYRMQKRVQCSAELRAYNITEGEGLLAFVLPCFWAIPSPIFPTLILLFISR